MTDEQKELLEKRPALLDALTLPDGKKGLRLMTETGLARIADVLGCASDNVGAVYEALEALGPQADALGASAQTIHADTTPKTPKVRGNRDKEVKADGNTPIPNEHDADS